MSAALTGLTEPEWDRPTNCPPWRVRDLLAHIRVVLGWLPGMLTAPAPARAEISARQYYRPDNRFSPSTNARRIALAQNQAATMGDGEALLADFTASWQHIDRLCRAQPEGRLVRTRHADAMLLSDFLLTRVLEVAVHGLDLALALEREPWLSPAAAAALVDLLLDGEPVGKFESLGWTATTFLLKATGRLPIAVAEAEQIERLGVHWPALG